MSVDDSWMKLGDGRAVRRKRSTLAGAWYPADPEALRTMVDSLLAEAPASPIRSLVGFITPHAGYQYSGAVAAVGYRALKAVPCERIVLLAPSHFRAFRGVALLDADAFETPLGLVAIDRTSLARLPSDVVRVDPAPYEGEHSLEIQLPFVQRVQPEAPVVPMLFGDLAREDYRVVGDALEGLAGERTVFIVSSDFTHYGRRFGYQPFPADDAGSVSRRLRELDMGAIRPVLHGDARGFQRYLAETGDTVCGRTPVTAFLSWAGSRYPGELLAYRTSLDVTGDYEHCVSYAAVAFARPADA